MSCTVAHAKTEALGTEDFVKVIITLCLKKFNLPNNVDAASL